MQSADPYRPGRPALSLTLALVMLALLLPGPARAAPDQATPTLSVDEVRVGMEGYGLTVFKGTDIEPFPVEVISITPNNSPGHAVVWIRCPSDRMQKTGAVQGMSGSPIYLWPDTAGDKNADSHEPGEGGKLIGAFAFGFANAKDAIVGVQPIGYMRGVGERAEQTDPEAAGSGEDQTATGTAGDTLRRVERINQRFAVSDQSGLYLDTIRSLVTPEKTARPIDASDNWSAADRRNTRPSARGSAPAPERFSGDVQRVEPLMLPVSVGSAQTARVFRPLFEQAGLNPVAGEGLIGGAPPSSVNAERASLEPGSVLAVPLAFGDVSMAAAGTVTDVSPRGTVVGFGHAMLGRGGTALPMATGYVHFIVPSRQTSFKNASGLELRGSLVQDEATAVAGIGEKRYQTVPIEIAVNMPGMQARQYDYKAVHHPRLTSQLTAMLAQRSITAVHSPPTDSTVTLEGEMVFEGKRPITIEAMMSGAGAGDIVSQIVPPAAAMMQNPHKRLKMKRARFEVTVEEGIRQATLADARVDELELQPGQRANITLRVQPYGKPIQTKRLSFKLPEDLRVGDYKLIISDAETYMNQYMRRRPHLAQTSSVDDLYNSLKKVLSIKPDALYVTLQLKERGVAVGRDELPHLPSSQKAMLTSPTSTAATPFLESINKVIDTPYLPKGQVGFTLHVRKPNVAREEKNDD